MGLMALKLATLNVIELRDSSKWARLLAELKNLRVDGAAMQETHFICAADSFSQHTAAVVALGSLC